MRLHIERENHRNHGQHKEWHFDGTLKTEGQWNEGYRSGVWTHYWPNGAKRKEERYIKGLKGGWFLSRPPNEPASLLTLYREDGTIRFSEARGGADTIQRLYYDDSGHPADRETYLRGKLILINGEKVMR
jgi:antitoxin component YwqK of YwqJK toxin-antitoxin module